MIVVLSVRHIVEEKHDQFTRALDLMEEIQSKSLLASDLSEKEFRLLAQVFDQSTEYLYEHAGQRLIEGDGSIEEGLNTECTRCKMIDELGQMMLTPAEKAELIAFAKQSPDVFHEKIDAHLEDRLMSVQRPDAIKIILVDINAITHDIRMRVRYMRWFAEYREGRSYQ